MFLPVAKVVPWGQRGGGEGGGAPPASCCHGGGRGPARGSGWCPRGRNGLKDPYDAGSAECRRNDPCRLREKRFVRRGLRVGGLGGQDREQDGAPAGRPE